MNTKNKESKTAYSLSRRGFLKSAAVLTAASISLQPRNGIGYSILSSPDGTAGSVLFETDFIPSGYSLKLAFIADHHYWPNHLTNWGNGTQMTRQSEERMLDLADCLNSGRVDISIHGGDVIDAGSAFNPPLDEYIKQLDFEERFLKSLNHTSIPMPGNHETPKAGYSDESDLDHWKKRFGPIYRHLDRAGWRMISLFPIIPKTAEKSGKRSGYGLDSKQVRWLDGQLKDAETKGLKVLLFSHVSPLSYVNRSEFELLVNSYDCVKAMFCGHEHRNYFFPLGKVPVLMRAGNAMAPLAYSMIYPYPDGRLVVVQKSQHFPFMDFVSTRLKEGAQGREIERYLTLGASSAIPLSGMKLIGPSALANIRNGHLRLDSGRENQTAYLDSQPISIPKTAKGVLLIETPDVRNARLSFSAVPERAARMGAFALADQDGGGGIETSLSVRTSGQGKLLLTDLRKGKKDILDRNWFNVHSGGAYRCVLEVLDGRIKAEWKNMAGLTSSIQGASTGKFGIFVEDGTIFVTDLKLEKI
jgi:hypothetical protein